MSDISTSKVSDLLNASATSSTQTASSANDLGTKEAFLNLLVTQLKYQDPLNPMESSDFSAQLAQFSQLEQLININELLEKGQNYDLALNQNLSNSLAASFIGKSVKAQGETIQHTGEETEDINIILYNDAEETVVEIKNSNDTIVKTITVNDLEAGESIIEWDGKDDNGNTVASGRYTFDVTAKDTDGEDVKVEKYIIGKVEGIRFIDGYPYLVVNGESVLLSGVGEVFE